MRPCPSASSASSASSAPSASSTSSHCASQQISLQLVELLLQLLLGVCRLGVVVLAEAQVGLQLLNLHLVLLGRLTPHLLELGLKLDARLTILLALLLQGSDLLTQDVDLAGGREGGWARLNHLRRRRLRLERHERAWIGKGASRLRLWRRLRMRRQLVLQRL